MVDSIENMDSMDVFKPIFIRNRRYITLWTPSPKDGVQEVGGSPMRGSATNPLAPTTDRLQVQFLDVSGFCLPVC